MEERVFSCSFKKVLAFACEEIATKRIKVGSYFATLSLYFSYFFSSVKSTYSLDKMIINGFETALTSLFQKGKKHTHMKLGL